MLRLLLLRHAQSTWNAEGRWQGRADPPLSEVGQLSCEAIAPYLGDVGAVFSSPLLRSRQTAQIIARSLGIDQIRANPDLSERNLGEWTGLTRQEVEQNWPGYLETHRWPPSAETTDSIRQRAHRGLREIAAQVGLNSDASGAAEAKVLVVTHGGLITAVEQSLGHSWRRLVNLSGREILASSDPAARPGPSDITLELGQTFERPDELSQVVYDKDSPVL